MKLSIASLLFIGLHPGMHCFHAIGLERHLHGYWLMNSSHGCMCMKWEWQTTQLSSRYTVSNNCAAYRATTADAPTRHWPIISRP